MITYTKEVYSELYEFLELIDYKYIVKIPNKLLQFFEDNRSENYIPHIRANIPVKEQSFNEGTLAIIALLNLKYWCEDEKEIKRLKQVYKTNEEKYQEKLKEQFDYNNIFEERNKNNKKENKEIVEYKKIKLYQKVIYIIKKKIISLFKR